MNAAQSVERSARTTGLRKLVRAWRKDSTSGRLEALSQPHSEDNSEDGPLHGAPRYQTLVRGRVCKIVRYASSRLTRRNATISQSAEITTSAMAPYAGGVSLWSPERVVVACVTLSQRTLAGASPSGRSMMRM